MLLIKFLLLFFCAHLAIAAQASPAESNRGSFNLGQVASQSKFLPLKLAFPFEDQSTDGSIVFSFSPANGYYLYRKSLQIVKDEKPVPVILQGKSASIEDPFFGWVEIYSSEVSILTKKTHLIPGDVVQLNYQGCAEAGFCYPPEKIFYLWDGKNLGLQTAPSSLAVRGEASNPDEFPKQEYLEYGKNKQDSFLSWSNLFSNPQNASQWLRETDFSFALLLFFIAGLALAFTPCVLPMAPIVSAIILKKPSLQKNQGTGGESVLKNIGLSVSYVVGMALAFAFLGVLDCFLELGGKHSGISSKPNSAHSICDSLFFHWIDDDKEAGFYSVFVGR